MIAGLPRCAKDQTLLETPSLPPWGLCQAQNKPAPWPGCLRPLGYQEHWAAELVAGRAPADAEAEVLSAWGSSCPHPAVL